MLAVVLGYAVFAVSGGAVHAGVVTGLIVVGATVSLVKSGGATWSQWLAILLMAPCAWGAGRGRG